MKTTKWIIIYCGGTGTRTPGGIEYNNYEAACMMQEILERQNPYTGFLIYTTDEWVHECEMYA